MRRRWTYGSPILTKATDLILMRLLMYACMYIFVTAAQMIHVTTLQLNFVTSLLMKRPPEETKADRAYYQWQAASHCALNSVLSSPVCFVWSVESAKDYSAWTTDEFSSFSLISSTAAIRTSSCVETRWQRNDAEQRQRVNGWWNAAGLQMQVSLLVWMFSGL